MSAKRGLVAAVLLGVITIGGPAFSGACFAVARSDAVHLTHAEAAARLKAAGITWWSSGDCANRNRPECTSFEQIRAATIAGVITFTITVAFAFDLRAAVARALGSERSRVVTISCEEVTGGEQQLDGQDRVDAQS